MSYQVLARKWRPKFFHEMVGQEHVLRALINALDEQRLHHAYLFTGTRGVGKTTIARILAKCLNCEQGVSSRPCGECSACREIAEGRFVDLIEVDAASRTKVEDTRELLDNVQYAPTRGRYKVYLIDEVHMLSTHSFNALLKTLEEPPEHVKFLLATTDPQKLPVTVLSRCLQFSLKNMTPESIVGYLETVLDAESVQYEMPALWQLGRAAQGSMRDALSLTDQAIAFGEGNVYEHQVTSMLGTMDRGRLFKLAEVMARGSAPEVLAEVAEMAEHGPDFDEVVQGLLGIWHRAALAQVVPDAIDNAEGDREAILALAVAMNGEDLQLYYQIALSGRKDLAMATDPRQGFEMLVLRMLAFRPMPEQLPQALADLDLATALTNPSVAAFAADDPAAEKKKLTAEPSPSLPEASASDASVSEASGAEASEPHLPTADQPVSAQSHISEDNAAEDSSAEERPAPEPAAPENPAPAQTIVPPAAPVGSNEPVASVPEVVEPEVHHPANPPQEQPSVAAASAAASAPATETPSLQGVASPSVTDMSAQQSEPVAQPAPVQNVSSEAPAVPWAEEDIPVDDEPWSSGSSSQPPAYEEYDEDEDDAVPAPMGAAMAGHLSQLLNASAEDSLAPVTAPEPEQPPPAEVSKEDLPELAPHTWWMWLPHLPLAGLPMAIAKNSALVEVRGNEYIFDVDPQQGALFNANQQQRIQQAVESLLPNARLVMALNTPRGETPDQRRQRLAAEAAFIAQQAIETDDKVRNILSTFNAMVVPDSIQPLTE